jgi:hypothetical protein
MDTVYTDLKRALTSYTTLRKHFGDFQSTGAGILKGEVPAVKIEPIKDDQFDASLAGATVRFVFTMIDREGVATHGRVTCYRLSHLKPSELEKMDSFDFDNLGNTKPKVGPARNTGMEADAARLIGEHVLNAIVEPTEKPPAKSSFG